MSHGPNFCWHIDGKLTACTPPWNVHILDIQWEGGGLRLKIS
jgi:hypothetical protein